MFSVRVVSLDHYIAKPINELCVNEGNLSNEWQEPVLRIFGTTADGFKTCVHIHGVYPYIYVPYKGGENPERDALLIGAALDKALKNSLYTKISKFIRKVTLISGLPLYGYHSKHRQFFKVYFYNPFHIRKTSELLLSGAILGQKFQPHEAHIPYALQFMMDYNIYGMSFITFARVKYRRNPECPDSLVDVRKEDILSDKVKKITCSYFEVDALASDIMNRVGQEATLMNPGLRAIWEDEKNRRREQNRNSDITMQQSHSRPFNDIFPIEIMYKNQLAEKLVQITFEELEEMAISVREDRDLDEPIHSYPAEIPEYGDFLEASAIEVVDGSQSREYVSDAVGLVDQRILTQIVESQKEKAKSESEEDEIEVDSVLGRNQRAEEEAELEDEEGVDMTQPLDFDEKVICGAEGNRDEPGFSSGESEKAFWKDMADKIFQLDGAQESSSESEAEATSTGLASGDRTSGGPLELSSVWSSNIMSILSEDSGCPTPSTICQTPRTFWSNYSPNWLPQNQDAWAWNKTGTVFSDFAGKNQSAGLNLSDFSGGLKEIVSGEPYGDFFTSNDHEYFPPSGVTPLCSSLESTISPPAILTPVSEAESSDINLDSICESFHSPLKEERSSLDTKFSEARTNFSKKPENDRQKFLQVLKTFAGKKMPSEDKCGQMTLKQYIKDCKEIVSVDFKNLCNQEMVIIEYKSQNKRSLQNKYLIKPLDKFLESWNSAERKASDIALPKESDKPKIISGFNVEEGKNLRSVINVLEKRFSDSSTLQSVSNKLTVKSMEILPDGGSVKDRSYNINQNMISQGQIKMKLIKSQQENLEKNLVEETIKRRRSEKCLRLDLKRMKAGERNEVQEAKEMRKSRRESIQKSQKIEKCRKKWKNFSEPDTKLINEINSSFEEYFKSIVQRKNFNRKKKSIIERVSSEKNEKEQTKRDDEEEISEDEKPIISPAKKMCAKNIYASPTADSIKFVTRFLSTFSRMSDMPPWSVTISLGNPRASVPIQVNLQPTVKKEVKYYSKKQRRKIKVESVDGPADGSSSSEESAGGHFKRRICGEKKIKREGHYKPLNVVVYGSPSEKKADKRGKKMSSCKGFGKKEESEGKKRKESALSHSSEDPFDVCRENSKSSHFRQRKKEKNSVQSLIKRKRNQLNLKKSTVDGKTESSEKVLPDFDLELDFIDDSDEERKRKLPGSKRGGTKSPKMIERAKLNRIPQADTEAFSSSGDDELMLISEKTTRGQVLSLAKAEGTDKDMETSNKEIVSSYDKLFSKSEGMNELNLEKAECKKQESFTSDVPRQTPLVASSGQTLPPELRPADPEYAEECESSKQRSQEAGPSFSHDCSSKKSFLTQPTLSPFTLSGSPLFASHGSNADSATSQTSKALTQGPNTVLPFTKSCQNSGSSESAEFYHRANILGGSEPNDRELKTTPPIEMEVASLDWVISCKTIRPRLKPPSWKEIVESMQRSEILESEHNTLFYGDPRDATKAMETGPRILKIENRSLTGLKLFRSSLSILGAEERRNLFSGGSKKERYRLVGDATVSITPLMKPPPFKAVLEQLLLKSGSESRGKEPKKAKIKIIKPVSPEQEINSDEEMNLSVTLSNSSEDPKIIDLTTKDSPENALKAAQSQSLNDLELGLKKGPLSKIKGIKRFSLLKKLEAIPEEMHLPNSQSRSPPCVSTSSKENKKSSDNSFQIKGVTFDNTFGFSRSVEHMQNAKPGSDQHQYMNMLVIELHVQTRKDLRPDPDHDPIRALFYAITFDSPSRKQESGILVVGENFLSGSAVLGHSLFYLPTEKALIEKLLALVKIWDPEILAGYEIEMHSWGYLVQRGFTLEMNMLLLLGRVKSEDSNQINSRDLQRQNDDDEDDVPRNVRHMRVSGRIVLDVWRVLRHEVALTNYTFENVMYHLSHERLPCLSFERLSYYWDHPSRKFRHIVVEYYTTKVLGVVRILDQLDFINRTSELSRLFGIQFYEVLSRGSQFRVESIMLRLAKPLNYVPTSPSVSQRAAMRAPASLPLILEPESLFYSDPIVVLDFQSLYPSIIIAYNYCFSTCLGRVEKLGRREPFEFGCTQLQISPEELKGLENDINISPAGVAFVKSNIRKGVLPTMLEEILEARLMVKKSMKEHKDNKVLQKVLFARQLGLKLIANVTYGYTAANFSGRMPCIEVGDSVVSKGRETLQRAIQRVKNTPKWGARVVYGDTDSIFVLTPGRSREEAFKIGAEIAEAITQDNPKPVKLKLEKVYQPSILQTKKRYLGYMYETPDQEEPIFEAKGIETVRRDGCPAIKKVLEKALRILFDTRDVSLVKKYTIRQFSKLFQGRVNIQDLIFAKEYRGRKGYRPGACVPALHLARQWTQYDKRAEPRVKERVPYVIVSGPPGVPLIRLVRSPTDLISEPSLRINAFYYITKAIIPPLQRCFSLLGADVTSWLNEVPRKYQRTLKLHYFEGEKRSTISQYFAAVECVVCSEVTSALLCQKCEKEPQALVVNLSEKVRRWERCHDGLLEICRSCCGRPTELDCTSLDCPVFFRRSQAERTLKQAPELRELLFRYL